MQSNSQYDSRTLHVQWQAVIERDSTWDGVFVYAVTSTGIYCRPSCPSKKPARENIRFFAAAPLAEHAGFRPCKRCLPQQGAVDPQVDLVGKICHYIEANLDEPLTLRALSDRFHISPYHLQRTFKKVTGISPRKYAEGCRMDRVRGSLKDGAEINEALYEAGFTSSSGLYSRANEQLGMTPKTYKRDGQGIRVVYVITRCPLGYLLVAATESGICSVTLGDTEEELERAVREEFPQASVEADNGVLAGHVRTILQHLDGQGPHLALPLDVRATAFQKRVWQALQQIPYGETRTYSEIAQAIGEPKATRAVARACATNPTALVVPCHRVIRTDGSLGGYKWGVERKRDVLAREKALITNDNP